MSSGTSSGSARIAARQSLQINQSGRLYFFAIYGGSVLTQANMEAILAGTAQRNEGKMTLAEYRLAVRRLCGNPDDVEVTDADIEAFVSNEALTWLNQRRPGKALSYFETVDEQQDYDKKPTNAYRVTDVFWMGVGYDIFSPSMRFTPDGLDMNSSLAEIDIVTSPAIVEAAFKNFSQYEKNFSGVGIETEEGKIRLMPMPTNTGDKVYFFYNYPRWSVAGIDTVPSEHIEGLKYNAASKVLEALAIKRGMIRGGRDFRGGGGANESKYAKEYSDRANELIPDIGSVIFKA